MAVPSHKKSSYDEGSLDQYLRDISAYPLIERGGVLWTYMGPPEKQPPPPRPSIA